MGGRVVTAEPKALIVLRDHGLDGDHGTILCPAHDDHDPSLSVSIGDDGRVLLHCFAGCSFDEILLALNLTATELHVPPNGAAPPERDPDEGPPANADEQPLFRALDSLTDVWQSNLIERPDVVAWIEQQYGFGRDVIDRFRIGYGIASDFHRAVEAGADHTALIATGAFALDRYRQPHPLFQRRVVFPYLINGRPVYAIARRTPYTEDNSYETPKYKKLLVHNPKKRPYVSPAISNSILWGEDILSSPHSNIVLTEGITDAIAATAAGFPTISPVTVRLKTNDVRRIIDKLRGRVETLYLVQDNEFSGIGEAAALKTAGQLEEGGISCRVATLPLGETQERAYAELRELLGTDLCDSLGAMETARQPEVLRTALNGDVEKARRAEDLIAATKIDVAEFFRVGATAQDFRAVLDRAKKPEQVRPKPRRAPDPTRQGETPEPGQEGTSVDRSPEVFAFDEFFRADHFAWDHGDVVRYCHESRSWFEWDGMRWRLDRSLAIEGRARSTLDRIAEKVLAAAQATDSDAWRKSLRRLETRIRSKQSLRACVELAASTTTDGTHTRLCCPRDAFDRHETTEHLLNCPNGVLDLRTFELIPHDPTKQFLITKLCPTRYRPDAGCPRFMEALGRIFEIDVELEGARRLIELFQIGVGYSLLGEQTHHLVFLMYGPEGRNGKSLLIRIVRAVLGPDYSMTAPPGLLRQKHGETHPTELADLYGMRFVATIEMGRGEKLDEARLKHLSGGDPIKARHMQQDFFEFPPSHHLWIATNDLPRADASDRALWARFRVIPFRRRFLKPGDDGFDESANVMRADDTLGDRLLADESEGILNFFVEGARKYRELGAVPNPPESQYALKDYREDNDPVSEWIEDRCNIAGSGAQDRALLPEIWATSSEGLYLDYSSWKEARNEYPLSSNNFGRALTSRGFPSARIGNARTRARSGILLKETEKKLKQRSFC